MTWQELQKELKLLQNKINYSPDIIVGIVRGGIVPARILSSYLNVKNMFCLNVKKIGNQREVSTAINENISGKNILLVEDMLETGKSLIVAKKYLEQKGATVKTVCLYTMQISKIMPDYFIKEVANAIKFPWE